MTEMAVSVIFGILSVVIAALGLLTAYILSKRTDKLIHTEDERAKTMIEEGKKETHQMIEGTQRMIEGTHRMIEGTHRMIDETHRMIDEGRRETRELIQYIASLISSEGEKTRELIRMAVKK